MKRAGGGYVEMFIAIYLHRSEPVHLHCEAQSYGAMGRGCD